LDLRESQEQVELKAPVKLTVMPTNNICWEQGNKTWNDVEVAGPGDLYEGRPGVMRSAVSLSSLVLHDGIQKTRGKP
jgi:hypothetical protein